MDFESTTGMMLHICICIMTVLEDQKLVGHFSEDRIFYRLLTAVPLKMFGKFGQPKCILVSQMLKVGKWPMANCYF